MNTNQTIITAIDELGLVRAKIAELELAETELKARLADLEAGPYEGQLFRLSIVDSERNTLDMKAVRAKLSRQFIVANTTTTPMRIYRVSARNGRGIAA